MRVNGQILEKPRFSDLAKFSSLRVRNTFEFYGDNSLEYDHLSLLSEAQKVESENDFLWRHDFTRYSSRQNKKLSQQGILGEITFTAQNLELFLPLLIAAETLHIGSATIF